MAGRTATASAQFDTRQAARIVGVAPRRLRECIGAGLLSPTRDGRGRLRFDFVDLVLLRTMRGLLDRRVPVRRVGYVLASLRRQLGDRALSQLNVYADGRRVVAWDGKSRWQPDSGQFLFNFDVGRVVRSAGKVAQLPHRAPKPQRRSPEFTPDDWCDLALELEEDSPDEAQTAYRHALELDAEHVAAHINLGCLLHACGELRDAEKHYRRALASDPLNGLGWYNLGVLIEDRGRLGEALQCYRRAVKADANLADAHYNLALLYERADRKRDALRHLAIFRRLVQHH